MHVLFVFTVHLRLLCRGSWSDAQNESSHRARRPFDRVSCVFSRNHSRGLAQWPGEWPAISGNVKSLTSGAGEGTTQMFRTMLNQRWMAET
jgi:hypothetical protein